MRRRKRCERRVSSKRQRKTKVSDREVAKDRNNGKITMKETKLQIKLSRECTGRRASGEKNVVHGKAQKRRTKETRILAEL